MDIIGWFYYFIDGIIKKVCSKPRNLNSRVFNINANHVDHRPEHELGWKSFQPLATYAKGERIDPKLLNYSHLAILKLDVKDSFGYTKEIESMGKILPMI